MKLQILGCDGGRGLGNDGLIYNNTSLLINDTILIDAGSVTQQISLTETVAITDLVLSHCHLDHVTDLPFMMDNCFEQRAKPLAIHGSDNTLDNIMKHIFNDGLWPNFMELPNAEKGQFSLHPLQEGEARTINGVTFTPFNVDHTIPTYGFKIEEGDKSIIFSADTGKTNKLWDIANNTPNLKAIILDLSFPNSLQHVADVSGHNTAKDVEKELQKLQQDCDVYVFHFKVGCDAILKQEMAQLSHMKKPLKALRDYKEITF